MTMGRVVSSVVSCTAVLGCAVVVVGMTRAASAPSHDRRAAAATPSRTERPAYLPRTSTLVAGPVAASSTGAPSGPITTTTRATAAAALPSTTAVSRATRTTAAPTTAPRSAPARTTAAPTTTAPTTTARRAPAAKPRTQAAARPAPARTVAGQALPLRYSTGTATRVVTVTAGSSGATTARLQAWTKVSTGRWTKHGAAVTAKVGAAGIGRASESTSKTPAGSWTLTRAFGRNSDPGTALPYFRTTPSDYWISTAGSKYNTHQRCGSCGYNNGINERLHYVNPEYDYAVVIDYNTRNAPGGVKQGRGSAFFLHVSTGAATAGCVAIPRSKLVPLMRWLSPRSHPRILIGVT